MKGKEVEEVREKCCREVKKKEDKIKWVVKGAEQMRDGKREDSLARVAIGGERTMFSQRVQKIGHKGRSGREEMEAE